MAGVLIVSGTASAALVGLVSALIAAVSVATLQAAGLSSPFDLDLRGWVWAVVAAGAALDATRLLAGRPAPPTYGRQVPREWAWIFPPAVTAALFGARLGVGPLTILSTWTWWSFVVASALLGPGPAVVAGSTFGLVRMSVTAWVSVSVHPAGHPKVFGRLRAGQRRGWATITVLTVLLVAATGCGAAPSGEQADPAIPTDRPQTGPDETGPDASVPPPAALITPAELEDVVRTATPDPTAQDPTRVEHPPGQAHDELVEATGFDQVPPAVIVDDPIDTPEEMAAELLAAIPGFERIADESADRYLTLRAAADLQPDPTEEVALLETRGFRGGWTRAFRNGTNDVAVASVYRFRDGAEAEFYLEDGLITIGGYGGRFFDITGLPGVRGFAQEISSSDGEASEDLVSLGASFNVEDRWYLLYFFGSPETITPDILVPAVTAQHQRATRS